MSPWLGAMHLISSAASLSKAFTTKELKLATILE